MTHLLPGVGTLPWLTLQARQTLQTNWMGCRCARFWKTLRGCSFLPVMGLPTRRWHFHSTRTRQNHLGVQKGGCKAVCSSGMASVTAIAPRTRGVVRDRKRYLALILCHQIGWASACAAIGTAVSTQQYAITCGLYSSYDRLLVITDTVWLPAPGGNDSHIDWTASRGAASLSTTRFDELYNHEDDTGADFNEMDTANLAYESAQAATVDQLFSVARQFFEQPPPPPPPPPPAGGLKLPPHPRLRIGMADVVRIRGLTGADGDPAAIELLRNITQHAEFVLSQPVPTGSDLLCDTILDHMYTLGMVYQLSTNTTFRSRVAQRATAELISTAALADWDPKRFLTVAETMHAVSIGYDWFYHELSEDQRTLIEDGLFRAGLGVGLACWRDNCSWTPGIPDTGNCSGCWWIRADMNWNLVSNGAIAIAALALGDVTRYSAQAKQALAFSAEGFPHALRDYGPADDGAWPEGPHYWS